MSTSNAFAPEDDPFVYGIRARLAEIETGAPKPAFASPASIRCVATNVISLIFGWPPEDFGQLFLGRGPRVAGGIAILIQRVFRSQGFQDYASSRRLAIDEEAAIEHAAIRPALVAKSQGYIDGAWYSQFHTVRLQLGGMRQRQELGAR